MVDRRSRTRGVAPVLVIAVAASVAGCRQDGVGGSGAAAAPAGSEPVIVGPELVAVLERGELRTGPRVVGSLEAGEQAVIRAELAGSIAEVRAELGQPVKRGEVLAVIRDPGVRGAYASAQSAVASAREDLSVAQRQVERTERLVEAGALAQRELDLARSGAAAARARLDQARALLANAGKQLEAATIRSPLDGVVSQRAVGTGDVVSPGSPLFTIIDPSSMRLQASVPSGDLSAIAVGAPVEFEVRGYPGQTFAGKITRVAPAADPATRQIALLVGVPNPGGKLVAGLFAEGRVASRTHEGLVAPATVVDARGARPTVLRLRDGKVEQVPVEIGVRDEMSERVELQGELAPGDRLLAGPGRDLAPGTRVQIAGPNTDAR